MNKLAENEVALYEVFFLFFSLFWGGGGGRLSSHVPCARFGRCFMEQNDQLLSGNENDG